MKIGGLQKTTLIDFPGKIAATVFLSGCSFSCPWCYSPELVLPEKITKHPEISEKYFFDFLESRKGMLDGIVICGGEPTINNDLPEFIKKIKDMGFSVKLDTNGSNPEMLEKLLEGQTFQFVDYIAMDIKAPLGLKSQIPNPLDAKRTPRRVASQINPNDQNSKYKTATGSDIDINKIKKSIELIKNSGVDYEFRSTIVPGVHSREDVIQMANDIGQAKKYYLQNFRPGKNIDPKFEEIKPYPDEFLAEIVKEISPLFKICKIR